MKLRPLVQAALALSTIVAAAPAVHADAKVEVLHYWTSGGEAKSAAELKKMMEAKGIVWKDFAVAGGGGEAAETALKARVMSGNPPTAAQIKGPAIQDWGQEGVLANIDAAAISGNWNALLPKVVRRAQKFIRILSPSMSSRRSMLDPCHAAGPSIGVRITASARHRR